MTIDTYTMTKLTADEGMVLTDKATRTVRSTVLYLGDGDTPENYIEIPDDPDGADEPDEIEEIGTELEE